MTGRWPAAVVVIALALPLWLRAESAEIYAIRGARLVTVSGPTVATGTIVFSDGRITAIGAGAAVPAGATTIAGAGLTVYPGLIDLGNQSITEAIAPPQLQNARTTAQVERWKRQQLLRPQSRAAAIIKLDESMMARLTGSGITSVLALPPGEVFSGQSALVSVPASPDTLASSRLVAPRRPLLLLNTAVALHVSFPLRPRVGTNAYPVSLMGIIAFVHQAFLDAQYYGMRQTRGQPMPEDAALAALLPALDRRLPVAFEANEQREIRRALRLAGELGLDPIITGGREAPLAASELRAQGARVIFSLNFPQRPRDLAPDADEPLRVLEARAAAPRSPGALARLGVPFAFASSGLGDPKDFLRNAAATVSAGLPPDAAIRALTLDAATIAGVGDRLGSLDVGKMATLIVTSGDLFDETARIVRVFIDGRPSVVDSR